MKKGFYLRMALENIRKNTMLYIPRILAEAGLLGCFYICITLALDERLGDALGGSYLPFLMSFAAFVIGLLSFVLILYVNSFLMKRRKSEYGLYNVLGMGKRHIIKVVFSESLVASGSAMALGLCFGILFYKAASLLICRLLHAKVVAGFYYLNAKTLLLPVVIFLVLDFFAFLVGSFTILRMKPVELMAGRHTGEREPRVKWFLLLLGIGTLGAGYTIALTVQSPLRALLLFFAAVLLVIVGTYCLFVTGTTFVLKCLQHNRRYYYQKRHMPAVAGLLFRMKQNAVGLASIAILATGVLVMISTTVSLYSGVQDTINSNYPEQLYLSASRVVEENVMPVPIDDLKSFAQETAEEMGIDLENVTSSNLLEVSYLYRDDQLFTKNQVIGGYDIEELTGVVYITQETFNHLKNQSIIHTDNDMIDLQKDEIGFCRIMSTIHNLDEIPDTLVIHGKTYTVAERPTYFPVSTSMGNLVDVVGIVVADEEVMEDIYRAQKEAYGAYASDYIGRIGVLFSDDDVAIEQGPAYAEALRAKVREVYPEASIIMDTKWETLQNILDMYGTFLFLGILLGFVCLFTTILIIYYKQISEGYEDRERFQIMEKIGMESSEVKKTIGSQLVLQFFLPLITAAIHTAFAFPILAKLLKILMLTNIQLFVICTLITLAVFAVVYTVVYLMTAKTYYKIVH